jgi:hypothetical protein
MADGNARLPGSGFGKDQYQGEGRFKPLLCGKTDLTLTFPIARGTTMEQVRNHASSMLIANEKLIEAYGILYPDDR